MARDRGTPRDNTGPRQQLEAAPDRPQLSARLEVDGAELSIVSTTDAVSVVWGRTVAPVDVVARTSYAALLDLSEGLIDVDAFTEDHLMILDGPESARTLAGLFAAALSSGSEPASR